MFRKLLVLIFPLFMLVACGNSANTSKMLVLDYKDFGPPVMSHQLLGVEWWQWLPHGDGNPQTTYDVKVVVYKDVALADVKKSYPVIEEKMQDYRYVMYEKAVSYLTEADEMMRAMPTKSKSSVSLQATREKIVTALQ